MTTLEDYDFDPRNLPKDLLAAIGLMTTSAAHTESCVDEAIAGCLGIDYEFGQAVTTHMTMPLRFDVSDRPLNSALMTWMPSMHLTFFWTVSKKRSPNEMPLSITCGAATPRRATS